MTGQCLFNTLAKKVFFTLICNEVTHQKQLCFFGKFLRGFELKHVISWMEHMFPHFFSLTQAFILFY